MPTDLIVCLCQSADATLSPPNSLSTVILERTKCHLAAEPHRRGAPATRSSNFKAFFRRITLACHQSSTTTSLLAKPSARACFPVGNQQEIRPRATAPGAPIGRGGSRLRSKVRSKVRRVATAAHGATSESADHSREPRGSAWP